jgi:hypothetical protein
VRPVGIGEVYPRLKVAGHQATAATGNLNLWAGLYVAVHRRNSHPAQVALRGPGWIRPRGCSSSTGSQEDVPMGLPPEPEPGELNPADPHGALLVGTMNGSNELGCGAMLWMVRHRWAAGARFTFNCHRHGAQLISSCGGRDARDTPS